MSTTCILIMDRFKKIQAETKTITYHSVTLNKMVYFFWKIAAAFGKNVWLWIKMIRFETMKKNYDHEVF